MAKVKLDRPSPLNDEVPTEVDTVDVPAVDPEVTPEVNPVDVAPAGPVIEYVGEGARDVVFTINPKASKYVVRADGMILESM